MQVTLPYTLAVFFVRDFASGSESSEEHVGRLTGLLVGNTRVSVKLLSYHSCHLLSPLLPAEAGNISLSAIIFCALKYRRCCPEVGLASNAESLGVQAASFSFGQFLTSYFWGRTGDQIGRKVGIRLNISTCVQNICCLLHA